MMITAHSQFCHDNSCFFFWHGYGYDNVDMLVLGGITCIVNIVKMLYNIVYMNYQ